MASERARNRGDRNPGTPRGYEEWIVYETRNMSDLSDLGHEVRIRHDHRFGEK